MSTSVELDIEGSRVRLGDKWFPAVVAFWDSDPDEPPDTRLWSANARPGVDWSVDVLMENGAMVTVAWELGERSHRMLLDLYLGAPVWNMAEPPHQRGPISMYAGSGRIIPATPWRGRQHGETLWLDCEPEWAAEHIERLSKMPCQIPSGKRMKFIRLNQAEDVRT